MLPGVTLANGNQIPLMIKKLSTNDIFLTSSTHLLPNGHFGTVIGDGDYIICIALAWRNKAFSNGGLLAWVDDSKTYAVLEGRRKV